MNEEECCHSCQGTGIGYPVDYPCTNCQGTGCAQVEIEQEPDDFDDCDSYEAEKVMWAGQEGY